MKSYKARGIVLNTVKYGETSTVVFMLTDTAGRQNYLVQGARGGKSKGNKSALFQPLFPLEFVGLESSRSDLHRMKEVRSAFAMKGIPFDVRKSAISLFVAEVLYRVAREIEADSPLFDFVFDSVAELDALEDGIANFHLWFLVQLSRYLGFFPGNEFTPGSWFDIEEGLFTPIRPRHPLYMNNENSQMLGQLMETTPGALGGIKAGRAQRSDFMNSMLDYFGYHLDSIMQVRQIQKLHVPF